MCMLSEFVVNAGTEHLIGAAIHVLVVRCGESQLREHAGADAAFCVVFVGGPEISDVEAEVIRQFDAATKSQ